MHARMHACTQPRKPRIIAVLFRLSSRGIGIGVIHLTGARDRTKVTAPLIAPQSIKKGTGVHGKQAVPMFFFFSPGTRDSCRRPSASPPFSPPPYLAPAPVKRQPNNTQDARKNKRQTRTARVSRCRAKWNTTDHTTVHEWLTTDLRAIDPPTTDGGKERQDRPQKSTHAHLPTIARDLRSLLRTRPSKKWSRAFI